MPNKLMKWDMITNTGNPTKLVVVHKLIKRVKKQEVRKRGKPSKTMELGEFHASIRMCRDVFQDWGFDVKHCVSGYHQIQDEMEQKCVRGA